MVGFDPKDKERDAMDEDAKKSEDEKAEAPDTAEDEDSDVIFTDWAAF